MNSFCLSDEIWESGCEEYDNLQYTLEMSDVKFFIEEIERRLNNNIKITDDGLVEMSEVLRLIGELAGDRFVSQSVQETSP